MGRMKELFIEEREINRDIDKHLDDEYHYNKWKKEIDEDEELFQILTQAH
tara:strand:- start:625 stop:774 length:150 start_codon:yes stop_codon:yes gene_type:complete